MRQPTEEEKYHYRVEIETYPQECVAMYRSEVAVVGPKTVKFLARNRATAYLLSIPIEEWDKTPEDAIARWRLHTQERYDSLSGQAQALKDLLDGPDPELDETR